MRLEPRVGAPRWPRGRTEPELNSGGTPVTPPWGSARVSAVERQRPTAARAGSAGVLSSKGAGVAPQAVRDGALEPVRVEGREQPARLPQPWARPRGARPSARSGAVRPRVRRPPSGRRCRRPSPSLGAGPVGPGAYRAGFSVRRLRPGRRVGCAGVAGRRDSCRRVAAGMPAGRYQIAPGLLTSWVSDRAGSGTRGPWGGTIPSWWGSWRGMAWSRLMVWRGSGRRCTPPSAGAGMRCSTWSMRC